MPTQNNFGQYLHREGVPVGVASQQELDSQRIRQETLTGIVERASIQDNERRNRLSDEIAELEFRRDQEKEAKAKNFKDGIIKTGLQAAGMAAGYLLAPATGGASAVLSSMAVGGGVGQAVGGAVVGEAEEISNGLSNSLDGLITMSKHKNMRNLAGKMKILNDKMLNADRNGRLDLILLS
jgi:hypothetical protein